MYKIEKYNGKLIIRPMFIGFIENDCVRRALMVLFSPLTVVLTFLIVLIASNLKAVIKLFKDFHNIFFLTHYHYWYGERLKYEELEDYKLDALVREKMGITSMHFKPSSNSSQAKELCEFFEHDVVVYGLFEFSTNRSNGTKVRLDSDNNSPRAICILYLNF